MNPRKYTKKCFNVKCFSFVDIKENLVKPVFQELSALAIENVPTANVERPTISETRQFTQGTTENIQVTFEDTSVNENESLDFGNYTFGSDFSNVGISDTIVMKSFTNPCNGIEEGRETCSPDRGKISFSFELMRY